MRAGSMAVCVTLSVVDSWPIPTGGRAPPGGVRLRHVAQRDPLGARAAGAAPWLARRPGRRTPWGGWNRDGPAGVPPGPRRPLHRAEERLHLPPRETTPEGEVHQGVGSPSEDRARKAFVLRQFHVAWFVNTCVAPASTVPPGPIVLVTVAVVNVPPGWRARGTCRFEGPEVLVEVFAPPEPGQDLARSREAGGRERVEPG